MLRRFLVMFLVCFATAHMAVADDFRDCQSYEDGDLNREIAACTRLIEGGKLSAAQVPYAHFFRGQAYNGKGEFQRAVEDFAVVLATGKDRSQKITALGFAGAAYSALDQHARALSFLNKAIGMAPKESWLYASRAAAQWRAGNSERAIEDISSAISREPANAEYYDTRCALRGEIDAYDDALTDCDKAVLLSPSTSSYLVTRCMLQTSMGRAAEGVLDCSLAIMMGNETAEAFNARCWALVKSGEAERAVSDCDAALEKDPQFADAYESRGEAYEALKQPEKAAADFRKALSLSPGGLARELALKGLERLALEP